MESVAPLRDTAMAAALAARSRLASGVMPDASAERKYPVNVSPAAVVSTTGTR